MSAAIKALELNWEEWVSTLEKMGEPRFRAEQICRWIWKRRISSVVEMTDLSKDLRDRLVGKIDFSLPEMVREDRSKIDGTRKFLWKMSDGCTVESALLKQHDRLTVCVSSQVGCPLACPFCATGMGGFTRNLTAGEIAGQFLATEAHVGREVNNLVFMGMGEPLLNTDAVIKAVTMLNHPKMRQLGIRHIAISTSGIIPGIKELADSQVGARLAVSLHASSDELRDELVPVNRRYPLAELAAAMHDYQERTGDRINIGYTLFRGVNDTVEHARDLIRYLRGLHVFINLIPGNPTAGGYERSAVEDTLKFQNVLKTAGFECDIRVERGTDIDAACGQLKGKEELKTSETARTAESKKSDRYPRKSKEDSSQKGRFSRAPKRDGDTHSTFSRSRKKDESPKMDDRERPRAGSRSPESRENDRYPRKSKEESPQKGRFSRAPKRDGDKTEFKRADRPERERPRITGANPEQRENDRYPRKSKEETPQKGRFSRAPKRDGDKTEFKRADRPERERPRITGANPEQRENDRYPRKSKEESPQKGHFSRAPKRDGDKTEFKRADRPERERPPRKFNDEAPFKDRSSHTTSRNDRPTGKPRYKSSGRKP